MSRITPSRANTTAAHYAFDNLAPEAQDRFAALEACLDPLTRAHLAARGVGPGRRCLEIGAGGGSIARWLGSQIGQHGYVLATDLDTRWTTTGGLRQVEARRHDIVGALLPAQSFDLIHARLVLAHLPRAIRCSSASSRRSGRAAGSSSRTSTRGCRTAWTRPAMTSERS